MRLLAGLGNPGAQYQGSRHNLGFELVDAVAKQLEVTSWKQFKGGELASGPGWLLFKPMQFMNLSGVPLRQVLDFYDLTLEDLCLAADDVYVAPGSLRIRRTGGDGGHNGWKSVIEQLGSQDFWRVRIGCGIYEQHPDLRTEQPALDHYVLQPLPKHEAHSVATAIDKITPDLVQWLEHGVLEEKTLHI